MADSSKDHEETLPPGSDTGQEEFHPSGGERQSTPKSSSHHGSRTSQKDKLGSNSLNLDEAAKTNNPLAIALKEAQKIFMSIGSYLTESSANEFLVLDDNKELRIRSADKRMLTFITRRSLAGVSEQDLKIVRRFLPDAEAAIENVRKYLTVEHMEIDPADKTEPSGEPRALGLARDEVSLAMVQMQTLAFCIDHRLEQFRDYHQLKYWAAQIIARTALIEPIFIMGGLANTLPSHKGFKVHIKKH